MGERNSNRTAWGLAVILGVVVLGGIGLLAVRLRPYWVARYHGVRADLHDAVLINAPLSDADLTGANLQHADLHGAKVRGAALSEANLTEANLSGAALFEAHLDGADLTGATLKRANLAGANLRKANLGGADLRSAFLGMAHLEKADLRGADLRSATLSNGCGYSEPTLTGAIYDNHTLWPTAWPNNIDPKARGAVRCNRATSAGPPASIRSGMAPSWRSRW